MLILARKVGEVVAIGDQITVMVCGIASGVVRLGVNAPNHISIRRPDAVKQTRDGGEPTRPAEEDMISAPRAKAMARQIVTLERALEYVRAENAELQAKLQDREHVE